KDLNETINKEIGNIWTRTSGKEGLFNAISPIQAQHKSDILDIGLSASQPSLGLENNLRNESSQNQLIILSQRLKESQEDEKRKERKVEEHTPQKEAKESPREQTTSAIAEGFDKKEKKEEQPVDKISEFLDEEMNDSNKDYENNKVDKKN